MPADVKSGSQSVAGRGGGRSVVAAAEAGDEADRRPAPAGTELIHLSLLTADGQFAVFVGIPAEHPDTDATLLQSKTTADT
jgi:hypothetical protein